MWFKKSLKNHLEDTKEIKIQGFKFIIRKLDVLDYLSGSGILQKTIMTYEDAKESEDKKSVIDNYNKLKKHYSETICLGVVWPKIKKDKIESDDEILVEFLFRDWNLAAKLYQEISDFTFGKKKIKFLSRRESK